MDNLFPLSSELFMNDAETIMNGTCLLPLCGLLARRELLAVGWSFFSVEKLLELRI